MKRYALKQSRKQNSTRFGISNTAGGGSGMRNAAPEEFDMSYAAAPEEFDMRKPAGRRN